MSIRCNWIGMSPDGETVVLRKFKGEFPIASYADAAWLAEHGDQVGTAVVLDVETTGLDRKNDTIIEIGLRQFRFNRQTGELLTVELGYSGLQDPGRPLDPAISALTGLTDAKLRDQQIDWSVVGSAISCSEIIIAHNASFDRPFIDRKVAESGTALWGCSFKHLDWSAKGFPSAKLEILSVFHGFFTDSHRALNDTDALLNLLAMTDGATGRAYLHELVERARQPTVRVIASGAPFEAKDALKLRGYRWDNLARVWGKVIRAVDSTQEIAWLEANVYRGKFRGTTQTVVLTDAFKE